MARWAKSTSATREHDKPLFPTVGTADPGESAARIAAIEVALDHLLDDGTEEAVLLLETGLIFLKELVKVMEKHPVEHGALRMPGAVDSCHSRDKDSGNRPEGDSEVLASGNNRTSDRPPSPRKLTEVDREEMVATTFVVSSETTVLSLTAYLSLFILGSNSSEMKKSWNHR